MDREFGYWAEQIPAIDSPLCAVVDPSRDYRWHSLRCGGPDIASFLCEMEGLFENKITNAFAFAFSIRCIVYMYSIFYLF